MLRNELNVFCFFCFFLFSIIFCDRSLGIGVCVHACARRARVLRGSMHMAFKKIRTRQYDVQGTDESATNIKNNYYYYYV